MPTTIRGEQIRDGTLVNVDIGAAAAIDWTKISKAGSSLADLLAVQTTTSTGTVHDFALTAQCSQLRCNNATLLTLTGLVAGFAGQRLVVVSVGAGRVDLANQGAGSSAANRIINGVTGTISLVGGLGRALLEYDGTTARWRVIAHEQGDWITPAYNAAEYYGGGAMTWTVEAGDIGTDAYVVDAGKRIMSVALFLNTTSVGGTLNRSLVRNIPGGFIAAKTVVWPAAMTDNGTVLVFALVRVDAGLATIGIARVDDAILQASTNLTYIRATTTFPVQ